MISLAGKTVLITGAAKRLGAAMAKACAAEGANIVVHYASSRVEAELLAHALARTGVNAWTVQGDLFKPANAQSIFDSALRAASRVDFLINNASIFPESTFADVDATDVHTNVDLHALSPMYLARALQGSGARGAVINMLDCKIADYDRTHLAYHLSKRMLHALTRIMAVELAPQIRVNGIAPGLVLPPEGKDENYLAELAHSNPLNTYGNAEDIAAAALFLLKSDFVTGEIVYVDGGRNLRGNMYGG